MTQWIDSSMELIRSSYEQLINESAFFTSDAFAPDVKFNRVHIFSSWYHSPSPVPFRMLPLDSYRQKVKSVELTGTNGRKYSIGDKYWSRFVTSTPELIPLSAMAEFVGLNGTDIQKPLTEHDKFAFRWQYFFQQFFLLTVYATLFLYCMLIFIFVELWWLMADSDVWLIGISFSIIYALFISVFGRLRSWMNSKKYAESLCVRETILILMELKNDDILYNGGKKLNLQYRLDSLARLTQLLPSRFPSRNTENQKLIERHFRNMAFYIREQERELICPTAATLEDMRRNFLALTRIYITENYGEFSVKNPNVIAPEQTSGRISTIASGLLRFIGLGIPLVLMGFYLKDPSNFPFLNLNPASIGLMFIAWLLLSIDSVFKLGIVKDLLSLSKNIKDLN
jgi:hypothetical protein